jgi:hypothetical protein
VGGLGEQAHGGLADARTAENARVVTRDDSLGAWMWDGAKLWARSGCVFAGVSEAIEHRQLVFEAAAGDPDGQEFVVEFSLTLDEAL